MAQSLSKCWQPPTGAQEEKREFSIYLSDNRNQFSNKRGKHLRGMLEFRKEIKKTYEF